MRLVRRVAVTAALATALLAVPAGAVADPGPAVTAADLPRLQAELAQVTSRAQALTDQLEQAAARDGGLRVALERLADAHDAAQSQLDARARLVYMRTAPDPLGHLLDGLESPELRRLVQRGTTAALTVDQRLIDAVSRRSAQLRALQARAVAFRATLLMRATAVLAAQDRARALLASAEVAAAQLAAAAQAQAQAALAVQQAALDQVSSAVTAALTPAQTRRGRAAAAAQAPMLALLEAAGARYPQGYAPTGQTITGTASWYGPGFVGNPTASGAPYDPEQPTCANKDVPLGTVLRVSANGRAVSCLVNDRGPYVGDRVLDMSRAGSRALGYDGLATVVIEVLAPAG